MYMNEHGHMCGPYPPEQLYEGLSTGFLPQNLAIYAVFGGKTADPVPLSFLKQFLSQWNFGATVSTPNAPMETKKVTPDAKAVLPDVWLAFLSTCLFHPSPFLNPLVSTFSLLGSFK